jgi:fructose-1,6-bisphosphatase I
MTVEEFVAQHAGNELGRVFGAVASATWEIAKKIRLAGLGDVYGDFGAVNVQGEQQQKLDVFANEVLTQALSALPCIAAIVSEEDEGPLVFEHQGKLAEDSEFIVIFDPLDGSSNIDVNVNVGTIFSVVRTSGDLQEAMLQPGSAQVAAGYVVYGPSCVMVLALNSALNAAAGVSAFTLDDEGHFVLNAEHITMPDHGPYFSANEANAASWPRVYRDYLAALVHGFIGGPHSARYIGSLVADFHRTLLKGGVFLYPPTARTPQGKLRLLYEARPLALIAERAGGAAVDGGERILDLRASGIHQRTALVVGSHVEVEALQQAVLAGEVQA